MSALTPAASAPIDWQAIADHRGRRNAALERELRHVHAERRRLERLLAIALRIAAGPGCDPLAMLDVVASLTGDRLEWPAWVAEERADRLERLVNDTDPGIGDPDRLGARVGAAT